MNASTWVGAEGGVEAEGGRARGGRIGGGVAEETHCGSVCGFGEVRFVYQGIQRDI